jgi:polyhydroxyalkanoate synthase
LSGAWRQSKTGQEENADALPAKIRSLFRQFERNLESADGVIIAEALAQEGQHRLGEFLDGVISYRRHSFQPRRDHRPAIWSQGTTALRDYRKAQHRASPRSRTRLLIVPSLVNRYYILDLMAEQSFLQDLADRGFSPFVLDWDAPGDLERSFALDRYIAGRLMGALEAVEREPGDRTIVIGYCMGGMLALALAILAPARLAGLVCLATPWDFHAGGAARHSRLIGELGLRLEPICAALGELPVDVLQSLFASLDPIALLNKFRRFSSIDENSDNARRFVALEDWLNDGVGLAHLVARECLVDWYGANAPANGKWLVAGTQIDPSRVEAPTLAIVPAADRIVPPESALSLAKALPGAEVIAPKAGHIGMMVGGSARAQVWDPLAQWLDRVATR